MGNDKAEVISLGAYQFLKIQKTDIGDQYTDSGKSPRALIVKLTTPMDETFVNRTVTALLSEQAQRDIIAALNENLNS